MCYFSVVIVGNLVLLKTLMLIGSAYAQPIFLGSFLFWFLNADRILLRGLSKPEQLELSQL
jgi:hypothetical protein